MDITEFTSQDDSPVGSIPFEPGGGPAPRTPDGAEQLSLLPSSDLPLQFRLDEETRRRGLRHVAEIQRLLAERRATRDEEHRARHLPRRQAA